MIMRKLSVLVIALICLSVNFIQAKEKCMFAGLRFLGIEKEEAQQIEQSLQKSLGKTEYVSFLSLTDSSLVETCAKDFVCYCKEARIQNADKILIGQIGKLGTIFTMELILIQTQNCNIENTVFQTGNYDTEDAMSKLESLSDNILTPRKEVTKSAVKSRRLVDNVPAVISVFTRQQMRNLGILRLGELFKFVPGFESIDLNSGEIPLHLGLPSTVLFVLDSVPMVNGMNRFRMLSRDFDYSVNNLQRVEFVRGPGSVHWGTNALFGVISFSTALVAHEDPTIVAQTRVSSLQDIETHASVSQRRPNLSYQLSATVNRSLGPVSNVPSSYYSRLFTDPIWGNSGVTDNNPDWYYDVNARIKLLERLDLIFTHIYFKTYYEISLVGGSLLDDDSRGWWKSSHQVIGARWEDDITLGLRYSLALYHYDNWSRENFALHPAHPQGHPNGLRSLQNHPSDPRMTDMAEGRLSYTVEHNDWHAKTMLGTSFLWLRIPDSVASMLGSDQEPEEETVSFTAKRSTSIGTFLTQDISYRWVGLSTGVRYEERSPYNSVWSLQAGAWINTKPIGFKIQYTEGFRAPDALHLYSTVGTQGNPDLLPEQSRAVQAEMLFRLYDEKLKIKIGGVWSQLYNFIILDSSAADPGFAYKPLNRGTIDIGMVFGEISWKLSSWSEGFVNYAFKDLYESNPQNVGIPVANHTASLGVVVRPIEGVNGFLTAAYESPREILLEYLPPWDSYVTQTLHNFWLSAGIEVFDILDGLDLMIKVENPFGLKRDSVSQLDGRSIPLLETRDYKEVSLTLRWSNF
jgi:hypothetical protein